MKFTKDIWIILISSFLYMCATMMINPIIAGYAGSLGAGATLMGFIGGLLFFSALCFRPFTGQLSDTITKRKLSVYGLIILIISTAGYMLSVNTVMLVISRAVGGAGFSCITVCMSTWLSGMFPRDKLGYGMGIYGMVNALCLAVGPIIGIELYKFVSYRSVFAVSLVMLVLCLVFVNLSNDKGEPSGGSKKYGKLEIIDVKVIPVAGIVMLMAMPYFATQTFLVQYVEVRELNVGVSLFFPAYAIALVILRLAFRNYFDVYPFRLFLYICLASEAVSIILLGNMNSNVILITAAVFLAGGYGIMCSVSQATAMLMADYDKRGLANSTYMFGLDIGTTLGALIGGFLFGNVPLEYFYYCFIVIVPLAIVIYLPYRERFRKLHE